MKHPSKIRSCGGGRLSAGLRPSISVLLVVLAGCGGALNSEPQPLDQLRWPGSMTKSGDGSLLYVVGTDFDLAFGTGAVQALDLAQLDATVDALPEGGEVARIDALPWRGGVQVSPFAGRIGVTAMGEGERLFVPIRGGGTAGGDDRTNEGGAVAVIDAASDGSLSCWSEDGARRTDCRPVQVPLLIADGRTVRDPYSVVVVGKEAFVGAIGEMAVDPELPRGPRTAWLTRMSVTQPNDYTAENAGDLLFYSMIPAPAGDLIFAGGRSRTLATGDIRSFPPAAFAAASQPQTSLGASLRVSNVGDLAFSSDGTRLYALGGTGGVGAATLAILESTGPTADDLRLAGAVALPNAPARLARLEGPLGDLVAITCSDGDALVIVDVQRREVVALLDGTGCADPNLPCPTGGRLENREPSNDPGDAPFGLVVGTRAAGGSRLWVGGFADGSLRAVDIPDLSRPWEARVRAVFATGDAR